MNERIDAKRKVSITLAHLSTNSSLCFFKYINHIKSVSPLSRDDVHFGCMLNILNEATLRK